MGIETGDPFSGIDASESGNEVMGGERRLAILSDPVIEPNERQQNKIIKILQSGDYNLINQRELEIVPQDRTEVLDRIKNGQIEENDFNDILLNIRAPYNRDFSEEEIEGVRDSHNLSRLCDGIFDEIYERNHPGRLSTERRVRSSGFDNLEGIVRTCRTSLELEKLLSDIVADKREGSLYQERKDRITRYKDKGVIPKLMKVLYGKQYEYWEQMKHLYQEARS